MHPNSGEFDTKVAVLFDCENADPDIFDYALRVAAQFGRVLLQTFTPCLQYAYAAGKNTSPILPWRWMPSRHRSTTALRPSAS